jgi:glycosyltransferase involved in cell wall biosynthesis
MKVLYVSNLYGDNARGGAEQIVALEARAMADAGDEVAVLRGVRRARADVPASQEKIRVIDYAPLNLYFYSDGHEHRYFTRLAWHAIDICNVPSSLAFEKVLESEVPDVVHTHNLMGLGFLLPRAIRRVAAQRRREGKSPLCHVHTLHDVQLLHPSGLIPEAGARQPRRLMPAASALRSGYIRLMRRMLGSPDQVLFPSAFLRTLHERHGFFGSSRREVLMNPAPAPASPERSPTRPSRFLFVGQIETHKGVLLLADAWEKARLHAEQGAVLAFAGDGSAASQLREHVARLGGVEILGKLSGAALSAAYDAASLVVVPSIVIENQPTVILEAMSRGTPVIATRCGGIPELVRENQTGWLVPAADAVALASALRRAQAVAAVPEQWQAMSRACVSWAAEHDLQAHLVALRRAYARPHQAS